MQERVYRTPILGVADLKRRLMAACSDLLQHVIDKARQSTSGVHGCAPV